MVARRGARVMLVVPKPLRRLLRTLSDVAEVAFTGPTSYRLRLHCPLISLSLAFGTTEATIPGACRTLEADPEAIEPWRTIIPSTGNPGGLKVGLVWAGASRTAQPHAAAIDRRRSMRLADLAPLVGVPGSRFISFQLGPSGADGPATDR